MKTKALRNLKLHLRVPTWARYIAQQHNRNWCVFRLRPTLRGLEWLAQESDIDAYVLCGRDTTNEGWETSLRKIKP